MRLSEHACDGLMDERLRVEEIDDDRHQWGLAPSGYVRWCQRWVQGHVPSLAREEVAEVSEEPVRPAQDQECPRMAVLPEFEAKGASD